MLDVYGVGTMLFSVSGITIGVFLFLRPVLAIELQRRFYVKINWRLKPISLPKEIISTKVMGVVLVLASLAGIVYLLFLCVAFSGHIYNNASLPY